ncbi:MAG: tetratricopeptide repeat protein [Deltaproteobacteria bacterium]|jgi:Tfp pilus assembly protein PilF|nr:tetratricopeptide repeat protein [Deltaproteobacteria bacterium]
MSDEELAAGAALAGAAASPPPAPGQADAADPVKAGEALFAAGDLDGAERLFRQAVEECPGNIHALNNLAVAALARGDRKAAAGHLKTAVEIKPDFLEGRLNLAELYGLEGKWSRAAKELERVLSFKPDDLPALKRLAQFYVNMGEPEKAKELLEGSEGLAGVKAFIDSLWLGIKFYSMAEGLSVRERLEKLMFATLRFIDGQDGRSVAFRLVGSDPDTGREITLERLSENFYYKEPESLWSASAESGPELILTVGDSGDWEVFHAALKAEMRAEGGCLGDFTQTKKVLKRIPELRKYDIDLTLKYFQANVGPCDCHVVRAVLV